MILIKHYELPYGHQIYFWRLIRCVFCKQIDVILIVQEKKMLCECSENFHLRFDRVARAQRSNTVCKVFRKGRVGIIGCG